MESMMEVPLTHLNIPIHSLLFSPLDRSMASYSTSTFPSQASDNVNASARVNSSLSTTETSFESWENCIMGILFIFGGAMIATGLILIFLRDKSSRLKFEKRVNERLKKLGVDPAVRKHIRETEKDALTQTRTVSHTESPNLSNTSLVSNI